MLYCIGTQYRNCSRILACIALLLFPARAISQSQPVVTRQLVWAALGQEILTPKFSADGNLIALATRAYVPDGGDAEGLPGSFFKALEAKEKAEPRYADPVIKVIDLGGKVVCETRFGWNPSLSHDSKRVVFSEQVKPITGFRALASPMAGNAIRMYDCETKQLTKIADPKTGYFDSPFFSPNGGSIVFTEDEAVNGSFGGAIGVSRYDLRDSQEQSLVESRFVPAVPCPSTGPVSGSCLGIEAKNLTTSFPQIIFEVAAEGDKVFALIGAPIPSPGDIYVAKNYDMRLISVIPEANTILTLGKRSLGEGDNYTTFQAVSGDKVLLFANYWRLFSLRTGEPLPYPGPRNTQLKSVYSPDLRYYIRPEPEGEADHFVLYRTSDGKPLESLPKLAWVYDAIWSPESNRFATIEVPKAGASPLHHVEQIAVYSIQ